MFKDRKAFFANELIEKFRERIDWAKDEGLTMVESAEDPNTTIVFNCAKKGAQPYDGNYSRFLCLNMSYLSECKREKKLQRCYDWMVTEDAPEGLLYDGRGLPVAPPAPPPIPETPDANYHVEYQNLMARAAELKEAAQLSETRTDVEKLIDTLTSIRDALGAAATERKNGLDVNVDGVLARARDFLGLEDLKKQNTDLAAKLKDLETKYEVAKRRLDGKRALEEVKQSSNKRARTSSSKKKATKPAPVHTYKIEEDFAITWWIMLILVKNPNAEVGLPEWGEFLQLGTTPNVSYVYKTERIENRIVWADVEKIAPFVKGLKEVSRHALKSRYRRMKDAATKNMTDVPAIEAMKLYIKEQGWDLNAFLELRRGYAPKFDGKEAPKPKEEEEEEEDEESEESEGSA